eukprot:s1646_g6.t1
MIGQLYHLGLAEDSRSRRLVSSCAMPGLLNTMQNQAGVCDLLTVPSPLGKGHVRAVPLKDLEAMPFLLGRPSRKFAQAHYASFLVGEVHFHAPIDTGVNGRASCSQPASTFRTSAKEDDLTSPFSSKQALHPGSGYWCSSGRHDPEELVVWTGIMHKRRKVRSLKVSWAYAPGQVRVRSTADGRHWETVRAPRAAG